MVCLLRVKKEVEANGGVKFSDLLSGEGPPGEEVRLSTWTL